MEPYTFLGVSVVLVGLNMIPMAVLTYLMATCNNPLFFIANQFISLNELGHYVFWCEKILRLPAAGTKFIDKYIGLNELHVSHADELSREKKSGCA